MKPEDLTISDTVLFLDLNPILTLFALLEQVFYLEEFYLRFVQVLLQENY
jgi:hypothetical protein